MVNLWKVVIKTPVGYDRFESFLGGTVEEVRMVVEETLKRGEKIRHIKEE